MTEEEQTQGATVTPIAPMAKCSGCGAEIRHEQRFDHTKHGTECPQPEIRMRRAEAKVAQLQEIMEQLIGQGNDTVTNQIDLNNRLKVLEQHPERLGSSEKHADQRIAALETDRQGLALQVDDLAKLNHALRERVAVLEGCLKSGGAWGHLEFPEAHLDERQRECFAQMQEAKARSGQ